MSKELKSRKTQRIMYYAVPGQQRCKLKLQCTISHDIGPWDHKQVNQVHKV